MASPQLDDGFTQVANEILERLAAACLNGREVSAMLLMLRFSYGMMKSKSVAMPVADLANYLAVDRSNASRILKSLEDKGLIQKVSRGGGRVCSEYQIQKDWEQWTVSRPAPWPRLFSKKEQLRDSYCCEANATIGNPKRNNRTAKTQQYTTQNATIDPLKRNNSSRETLASIEFEGPPIKDKKIKDKNPLTPTSGGGGGSDVLELSEKLAKRENFRKVILERTGFDPGRRETIRAQALLKTPVPDGWDPGHWKSLCKHVFFAIAQEVRAEVDAGKNFAAPVSVTCARAEQRLKNESKTPRSETA
jgi:phage replication O-like protein O